MTGQFGDEEKKNEVSPYHLLMTGVGSSAQSLAIVIGTLVLACVAALPDACGHPKLMVIYSAIVRVGPAVSVLLWVGGLSIKSGDGRFDGVLTSKERKTLWLVSAPLILAALLFGWSFDRLVGDLPKTKDEVSIFCEETPPSK